MADELNSLLANQSYILGYQLSDEDLRVFNSLTAEPSDSLPHLKRWYRHISAMKNGEANGTTAPPPLPTSAAVVPSGTADHLPEAILKLVADRGHIDSLEAALLLHEDHQKVVGAVKSLESLGDVIKTEAKSTTKFALTEEGNYIADHGSHEAIVFAAVPVDGIFQEELTRNIPDAKIGIGKALSAKWIQIDKSAAGGPRIVRKVSEIDDLVQKSLKSIRDGKDVEAAQRNDFKKRKLLTETTIKHFLIQKGANFSTTISKPEAELTVEMIASGSWKTTAFKPYNFDALGATVPCGHLHPLLKVRSEFRRIFFEMGFMEMETNNYVESSFWNFDALFQPQQHPARDAHDTFFISDPQLTTDLPPDYVERVKQVHSHGGYGSQGYQYDWKLEEAQKNLLRTHTTAVSARMLYKLAKQTPFKPAKYFSIDRVFRNETLDATHLAEFHQVEGVVADRGLTLGHLIGIIHEFFNKLGIKKLRFKPAYNPYTEPSMEIFSYHETLEKWVEVGNSGLFRPEMLLPMGLPEDVSVIAWGLSLERPTMIKYGYDNIRDLIGPRVNLRMVYDNPVCRLSSD